MCLSTVYKNTMAPETVVMKNVMKIECKDGLVLLTDLMERTVAVEGTLESANLVDGFVIIKENGCYGILILAAEGFKDFFPVNIVFV